MVEFYICSLCSEFIRERKMVSFQTDEFITCRLSSQGSLHEGVP
jgi:hypothetical protein